MAHGVRIHTGPMESEAGAHPHANVPGQIQTLRFLRTPRACSPLGAAYVAMVAKGSLNKTTLKMRELAGQHAPAAVRVLVELMQHANEGTQLNAACTILDRAYGRPRICTERNNNDDVLFANLFENGQDEADEAGTK